MTDPASYRPAPGEIPTEPGVYKFRDATGRVIYVGKAKSLRQRLSSYFQDLSGLLPKVRAMVTTAASVEWTVVGTEVEALSLEYSWIKEFEPRFNIMYRDDKSYPYLAVTLGEQIPRAFVTRQHKRRGTRYFGPYGQAWAIRETLDTLLRVFPVRTCSPGVLRQAEASGRPCLLGYIDKCSAPCVGRVTVEEHRDIALDLCDFMAGHTGKFTSRIEQRMREAAEREDFELAARLRDDLGALRKAMEENAVVLEDGTDADVFGLASDELEAAVHVFFVRDGRIRGERGWVVEKVEEADDAALVESLLTQVYGEYSEGAEGRREADSHGGVPREILVPTLPTNESEVVAWLEGLRGARVNLRVPQRGPKRELADRLRTNAEHALALHKTRRSSDLTTRSQALREIQEALGMDQAPLRIECYDISTTLGLYQVASMVVFEDGLSKRSEYRRFAIRGEDGDGARDDTEAMYEVLTRRFRRGAKGSEPDAGSEAGRADGASDGVQGGAAQASAGSAAEGFRRTGAVTVEESEAGARRHFAYPPSLIVVDGGPPQVAAARRALRDAGVTDVALCGLAKRLEEVWVPGQDYPVILERQSEGLYLLQRVRDEAHRFAITYHRKRRGKALISSVLDDVPGLGAARQRALLKEFGSVKRLKAASIEEIAQVKGIGPTLAAAVARALQDDREDGSAPS